MHDDSPISFTTRAGIAATLALLAGCEGVQSSLAPKGPAAAEIAHISWIMFIGAALILLLVMTLALYAMYRAPDKRIPVAANKLIIAGGVAFPAVTLTALLVYGVWSMGSLRGDPQPTLTIDVIGKQWWWEVHYQRDVPGAGFATANEIHIPVGVQAKIRLHSNDVIHSFWVPNLAGKMDVMPGQVNSLVIQADKEGVFRGQCAEFCGAQHARMAFFVIAQPRDKFDAWMAQQRAPMAAPTSDMGRRGQQIFRDNRCMECHAVRGNDAAVNSARNGPDLTHIASRTHLAGGTLPNTRDNLKRIIADSQGIKPGSHMPAFPDLSADALEALASYLEGSP
ncbi:cytochrome c oxidase subunit II [Massilia sp. H6]|uniref:cytochrome c oxidase subunit II n=1 Tax=Massilia sp. H6 TaxID=2970464 RepID=UPI002166D84A|nr:cytochrome c oxidase subunit II [Massilia sp. H6]UVW29271.1 cytochrome c oxidase subunit II [Massilia sp. H6]